MRDLAAERVGDTVQLRFTVPDETTDKLNLRAPLISGQVCRAVEAGPCTPLSGPTGSRSFATHTATGTPNIVTLRDDLDSSLRTGDPRLLSYRLEFFNAAGRSAGASRPAYALAGLPPAPVEDMGVEGSRQGLLLRWKAVTDSVPEDVLLRRERQGSTPAKPVARNPAKGTARSAGEAGSPIWLEADEGAGGKRGISLDDTAQPGETYTYVAQRRRKVELAGHALEMRSQLSAPVTLRLAENFALPTPAGLTAAGFGGREQYAVDLVWEPVNDSRLAGYLVRRTEIDSTGQPLGAPVSLNGDAPVPRPAFHDAKPDPTKRYRYQVLATDARGNLSAGTTLVVEPSTDTATPH